MATDKSRILIVDDNEADRLLLANVLEEEYDVVTAANGYEALGRAISEPKPELILLDIMMPEVDGYQVLAQLKKEEATRHIPVVFLTVKDDELDEVRGFDLGAVDYITKPYSIPVVAARVRSQLRIRRQAELLEKLAQLDPLTELANRRRYEEVLHKELGRARRAQTPLTVVVVDVDAFKAYNDRHSHSAGDECLQRVADMLRTSPSRSGDVVARVGGDEFALVLPETDPEAARKLTRQVLENLANLSIPHEGTGASGHVTVSVGVATSVPPVIREVEELLAAADAALHRAKEKGRNRAEFEVVSEGHTVSLAPPTQREAE